MKRLVCILSFVLMACGPAWGPSEPSERRTYEAEMERIAKEAEEHKHLARLMEIYGNMERDANIKELASLQKQQQLDERRFKDIYNKIKTQADSVLVKKLRKEQGELIAVINGREREIDIRERWEALLEEQARWEQERLTKAIKDKENEIKERLK